MQRQCGDAVSLRPVQTTTSGAPDNEPGTDNSDTLRALQDLEEMDKLFRDIDAGLG